MKRIGKTSIRWTPRATLFHVAETGNAETGIAVIGDRPSRNRCRSRIQLLLIPTVLMLSAACTQSETGNGSVSSPEESSEPTRMSQSDSARSEGDPASSAGLEDNPISQSENLQALPDPDLSQLSERSQTAIQTYRDAIDGAGKEQDLSDQDLANRYGQLAKQYHGHDLYEAAEVAYSNAFLLEPGRMEWVYLRGHAHRKQFEIEAAIQDFKAAIDIDSDFLAAQVALAETLVDQENSDAAWAQIEATLAQDPDFVPALVIKGQLAVEAGQPAEALSILSRAKELAPGATEINYPLGLAYRDLGQVEEAEEYLAQRGRIQADRNDPFVSQVESVATGSEAVVHRGVRAVKAGDLGTAETAFREAIELDPNNISGYVNLAVVLERSSKYDDAIETIRKGLEIDTQDPKLHFTLGSLLSKKDDADAAIEHLSKAVEIDPNFLSAQINLANALARQDRCSEAVEHYQSTLALEPANRGGAYCPCHLSRIGRTLDGIDRNLGCCRCSHPGRPYPRGLSCSALATVPAEDGGDPARAVELAEALVAKGSSATNVQALQWHWLRQGASTRRSSCKTSSWRLWSPPAIKRRSQRCFI